MAASRIMDAIELSPGRAGGQSDAPQAYCQAEFGFGMDVRPTYVEIPHDLRPKSWSKYKDPVVPLKLALYGHPLSGTMWERYYTDKLVNRCGFLKVPGWECLFYHRSLRFFSQCLC